MLDENDDFVWTECEDVYRPSPVVAEQFVQTLGLSRPPVIQSQQTYIFIRRPVYDQIQAHLKRNTRIEQGGLLFGQAFVDASRFTYLILIEAAVPAIGAQEQPTSITYTSEAWKEITPLMQQMKSAWTLIGSYHSHPGLGVYLSSTDLTTQADIFAQDWQIALVIDPVADEVGFFAGRSGEPCSEWYFIP